MWRDMNKNSYTYKRYCLKDGSASATLTPAQRDCLWALGLGVFSFSTTWYSLLMAYGPVVYQCLKAQRNRLIISVLKKE